MASRDDIKFLSNPQLGQNRQKYCRFKNLGSNTLIIRILTFYCNSLMSRAKFFLGGLPELH